MSKSIEAWLDQIVTVVTHDGRQFVGLLVSHDLSTNIVLQHSHERIYHTDKAAEQKPTQTLVIRGENVLFVALIDEEKDLDINFESIRGEQIPVLKY